MFIFSATSCPDESGESEALTNESRSLSGAHFYLRFSATFCPDGSGESEAQATSPDRYREPINI